MNALNVYILDKAATLHPYMHDIWVVVVVVGEVGGAAHQFAVTQHS